MRAVLDSARRRIRSRVPAAAHPYVPSRRRPARRSLGLAVRPDHFEEHLAVLRRSRQPLAMSEFVERLERRTLPADAVAVTFDDGYVDNLREAKPRLAAARRSGHLLCDDGDSRPAHRVPGGTSSRAGFCCAQAALDCEVAIAGEPLRLVFPQAGGTETRRAWRAWEPPRTEREATYLAVWRRLRIVSAGERERVMTRLRGLLDLPPAGRERPADDGGRSRRARGRRAGRDWRPHRHTSRAPGARADGAPLARFWRARSRASSWSTGRSPDLRTHTARSIADSRAAVQECGFVWACSTESCAVSRRGYDAYALPQARRV